MTERQLTHWVWDAENKLIAATRCAAISPLQILHDLIVTSRSLVIRTLLSGSSYLLEVVRRKVDYPTLRALAINLATQYKPNRVLVEDTGVGTSK
jgi:hypothetical protein